MNILTEIVAAKQEEVARLPERKITPALLREALERRGGRRDFLAALSRPLFGHMALIAEVKKASPSAGVICPDFDPVRIARQYEMSGASCLSVLTDERFFQGSLQYLRAIRKAVRLPLLRKDFVIDPRQVLEAVEYGADAILLIVAILSDEALRHLLGLASEGGLDVLVEVHDEAEWERAVAAGATLLGVNNRNLKTFETRLEITERLASRRAPGQLLVAESGIHTREDVLRLEKAGARAILVGESLMRDPAHIRQNIRKLLGIVEEGT